MKLAGNRQRNRHRICSAPSTTRNASRTHRYLLWNAVKVSSVTAADFSGSRRARVLVRCHPDSDDVKQAVNSVCVLIVLKFLYNKMSPCAIFTILCILSFNYYLFKINHIIIDKNSLTLKHEGGMKGHTAPLHKNPNFGTR